MASVAESSIASVPLSHLAHLRERLLQQPEARNATLQTQPSGVASSTSNRKDVLSEEVAASVPESANAYHTPKSSPKGPPRIAISKSASAVEMEAMVNPSPSQEAFATLTRASSFHGYPDGDTQPMESQVYREFHASVVKSTTTTPVKFPVHTSPGMNTYDTLATDKTAKTCLEGETGYMDLANALQSPTAQSPSSPFDALLVSPQTQLQREEAVSVPVALPETPAIAGRKRSRSGEILTSASTAYKQPGVSQFFGAGLNGPMLSTTQLFHQTQAPSSPPPDAPRSDPIVTRPSPNLHNNFNTSSPTVVLSSPIATKRPSTAGEPRDRYTSMRESQERRAVRLREELGLRRDIDDDILEEEDPEDDAEQRRFENKRMQRVKSDQVLQEIARFRPPSRSRSRPSSSSKNANTIDLTTPFAAKHGDPIDIEISDDEERVDDEAILIEEEPEDAEKSDDEYDELAQTVLRSQANDDDGDNEGAQEAAGLTADDDMLDNGNENHNVEPQPEQHEEEEAIEQARPRTQHSAIPDSQPTHGDQSRFEFPMQTHHPSSLASIVPGSQYAGSINHAQALPQFKLPGSLFQSKSGLIDQVQSNVPSSPPLPTADSRAGILRTELSTSTNAADTTLANVQVIPDSDLLGSDGQRDHSSRPVTASGRNREESNNLTLFSTAQTHVSAAHGPSPGKGVAIISPTKTFLSQHSKVSSQSPLKAAGVRRFADISPVQVPPNGSGESQVDVDAIMSDIMTADDQQFVQAVSSPTTDRPQKRRRLGRESSTGLSSPFKAEKPDLQQVAADAADAARVHVAVEAEGATEVVNELSELPSLRALQESPSKANEMPSGTPESVREREHAGAKAVSQLLSTRARKLKEPERPVEKTKKTDSKVRAARVSAKSIQRGRRLQRSGQADPEETIAKPTPKTVNLDLVSHEEPHDGPVVGAQQTLDDRSKSVGTDPPALIAANRVFALFKGQYNSFYAATWLGSSPDGTTFDVRFDDTTVTSIEAQHVRRLELRVGDLVKVDVSGLRNKTWLVQNFDEAADGGDDVAGTDIYGRSRLKVQAKSSRTSMPAGTGVTEGEGDLIDVAISSIYLTHTMWPNFKDRTFTPMSTSRTTRAATPSTELQTPNADTPTSRSRRTVIPTAKALAGRTSHLREESVSAISSPTGSGLFAGMAFALSFGSNEGEKADVTRLIQRNGGQILENGFDELFDLPSLGESRPTSPSKKKAPHEEHNAQTDIAGLRLKPEHENLGFVALIADRHSRRAKYVQALALGLPTLSGRWITDSLDPARNSSFVNAEAVPLSWSKYLLPAGESSYLGGAVRSRTMSTYHVQDAKLSTTIESRDLLLEGDGVLIVAPKKGKGSWERRKAYAFLTLALGASRVRRVDDLQEAKTMLSEELESWKWIYVDGAVSEASTVMFGRGGVAKKRKRDEDGKVDANAMSAAHGGVKIVNDEYVVQSLILGALVD